MTHGRLDSERRYRGLLVDYGGVLTTSLTVAFSAFCVKMGVRPERLTAVLAVAYAVAEDAGVPANDVHDLMRGVETGAIDMPEFERHLAAALWDGSPPPFALNGLSARLFEELRPDDRMRAAVRAARERGIRTGLVSNTWTAVGPPAEVQGLFDALVLSGKEGIRKPDQQIYRLAAARLDLTTEECVFVDDVPVNVEGARAVGMAAVLHRDAMVTVPKLEELLRVRLARA